MVSVGVRNDTGFAVVKERLAERCDSGGRHSVSRVTPHVMVRAESNPRPTDWRGCDLVAGTDRTIPDATVDTLVYTVRNAASTS